MSSLLISDEDKLTNQEFFCRDWWQNKAENNKHNNIKTNDDVCQSMTTPDQRTTINKTPQQT